MNPEQSWMQKPRPVNLNLFTVRFPVTAIVSIMHRLSGVLLFLGLPFLVWAFSLTLMSPDAFESVQTFLAAPLMRFVLWVFVTSLGYHLLAGIRHFIMDFGFGESWRAAKASAWGVFLLTAIVAILVGVWLW